jgi:hypothetical protein
MAFSPVACLNLCGDSDELPDEARIVEIVRLHLLGDPALLNDKNPMRQRGNKIVMFCSTTIMNARP